LKKIAGLGKEVLVAFLSVSAMLMSQGCGTGNNLETRPTSWNFSISGDVDGSYYLGDTLKFQSTAADNSGFTWTFGDGNRSILAAPTYAYYAIAHDINGIIADTITLVVNNDIYHSVVKPITLKPPVPRIAKPWSWTGGYFKIIGNCCPSIIDHPLADTIFDITKIDDYTIGVWGLSMPYLVDSNYFSNIRSTDTNNATYVIYTRDTLFFKQRTGVDTGGYQVTYFHKF
jgi:hypothetical protein